MILSETHEQRQLFIDRLLTYQQRGMLIPFKEMDSLPVTIRLLDTPLLEFLPRGDEAIYAFATRFNIVAADISALKEVNPMLRLRGCHLSVVYPAITEMQFKQSLEQPYNRLKMSALT